MRRMFTGSGRRIAAMVLTAAAVPLTIAACGGNKENGTVGETAGAPAGGTTGATPAPGAVTPAGSTSAGGAAQGAGGNAQASSITPQMVAEGDSIFHGQLAGGTCQTCHGPNAKGTPLAPDLTDNKWLTGDGSYQFVVNTDIHGVPNPTPPYTAPMPPMGGATLSPSQINAVAAYVYSLSHPNVGKK